MIDWNKYNFTEKELACPCCGKFHPHDGFLDELQGLRDDYGKPMIPNSCYRCEKHNAEIGGAKNSYHKKGLAIDIRCPSAQERWRLALKAMNRGWSVVVYKNFLHLDRRIDTGAEPILTIT